MENKRIKIQPITKKRLHSLPAMVKNIKIGNQIWSAENYNGIVCPNGDTLIRGNDYYISKGNVYYTYDAALRVVPKGWHIPNSVEWAELLEKCLYKRDDFLSVKDGGKDIIGFNTHYTGYIGFASELMYPRRSFRFWISEECGEGYVKYIYGQSNQYYIRKSFCSREFALTIRLIRN